MGDCELRWEKDYSIGKQDHLGFGGGAKLRRKLRLTITR